MNSSDLLTPSLTEAPREPIFSVNAMIAAAFFGGAFAVPLLATENARRLGRLQRDVPWLVLALLIGAAVFLGAWYLSEAADPDEVRRNVRLAVRALGFAWVGVFYGLHRHAYRTLKATGMNPASPYVAVIATVLLSFAITVGLTHVAASGILRDIP